MVPFSRAELTAFLDAIVTIGEFASKVTPWPVDDEWAAKIKEYRERFRVVAASPIGEEVMLDDETHAELVGCAGAIYTMAGPGAVGAIDWKRLFALVEKLLPILLPLIVP